MKTIQIYANYGCLAAEKTTVYTQTSQAATAVCSDKLTVKIPKGWEAYENVVGSTVLVAPWEEKYFPDEVLGNKDGPCFIAYDKNGIKRTYKLEVL